MNIWRRFRVWWFWNIQLKKNEFSPKLDTHYIYTHFPKEKVMEKGEIIMARREIAHILDDGKPVTYVANLENLLKRAKL